MPTRASSTPTATGATRRPWATSGCLGSRSTGVPTGTDAGAGRRTAGPGCRTSAGAGRRRTTDAGAMATHGWYWIPGRTWGPAWVSWAVGGGYVGWCPLGWRDRPVRDWDSHRRRYERGHAVPRGGRGAAEVEAWNVVRQGELGHRDLAQRRVSIDRVDPTALQVAASARFRPTRDVRQLREAEPLAHAISTRPTPGDFVRELAVDNKTTIPAPWFRRAGATPRGNTQIRNESDHAAGNTVPRSTVEGATGSVPANPHPWEPRVLPRTTAPRRSAARRGSPPRPTARSTTHRRRPRAPTSAASAAHRTAASRARRGRGPDPWPSPAHTSRRRRPPRPGARPSAGNATCRRRHNPVPWAATSRSPRASESAAASRQRDTGGGGSSRPSAESAAARSARQRSSQSSGAETRSSGDRSVGATAQRRDRR